MSSIRRYCFLVLGLLLFPATPGFGQTKPPEVPAAATFDRLLDVVRPGKDAVVTDLKGSAVVGQVRAIGKESLSLSIPSWGTKPYEMRRDDIQTIRNKPDSTLNGVLIGLAAGFAGMAGIVLGGMPDDCCAGLFVLGLIPAGGVAGYYIDRAISDRRLLYQRPGGPTVSFERSLGGNLGVRADVGLVSPPNQRSAPRAAANIVWSFGFLTQR